MTVYKYVSILNEMQELKVRITETRQDVLEECKELQTLTEKN